ncbi:PREDICTED: integrin alpha-L-like [Poecilia mexicana]|uniref:VWFA domain-containing protein n=1 Tax=Poecilia mexicana TaxID=48701 RepID=A0A3B3Z3I8_9TELE|nr:PREDICTED: integrin alpha-L-like [Poecilia mexicana]
MYAPRRFNLFIYMILAAAVIATTSAFNVDTTNPPFYKGEQKDFFGYKVLQYKSPKDKGVIVTAPLWQNGSGGISKYVQDDDTPLWFNGSSHPYSAKHLGLSITMDTESRFIACSPSLAHPCDENVYLNSLCYNITHDFELLSSFKPLFQKCIKKAVDLVFLFDGSESMTGTEFEQNKKFIIGMMESLKNTSIKFAAVQFSTTYRTVFNFKDYDDGKAEGKLMKEEHMKGLTNTYRALNFTLYELLENKAAGASKDANKAVVIITDGDPSELDKTYRSVETYNRKEIIRVVIGVKIKDDQFDKLRTIASEPKEKNVFKITNYDGLTGLLENFQKQIFAIEGSNGTRSGELSNEMAQSGFSAISHKDTLILASVGSKTWRGTLNDYQNKNKAIIDPEMQEASYMGYSLSVGERNGTSLYFTGAPRFNHMGEVVVFRRDEDKWPIVQRLTVDQIGSYFGAELCSVDIDSDGNTDFLLVGAPMFFLPEERKEGSIYVYALSDKIDLTSVLHVKAPSMGRFGTTISSLSDLNGDGLRDVAVGAPLEENNAGAVYIYLGQKGTGMRNISSQRITGAQFDPGLRFFGQSINGDIDLGEDQLPDIVVGSQGAAVVLRSKPVLDVKAKLSFYPSVISIQEINCLDKTEEKPLPMTNITACFEMVEVTNSTAGPGIEISFMIIVDPMRQSSRGFFIENGANSRNIRHTQELTDKETCFNYSISMNKCIQDTLSPVNIKLNFSQDSHENSTAILNIDSQRRAMVEVPFERRCEKDICIADLKVDFDFLSKELLVTKETTIKTWIKLHNRADDSYNTSLTMLYPEGLSFSMLDQTGNKKLTQICADQEKLNETVCGISLPVYRSKSSADFTASFRIKDFEWNDTMLMTVFAKSENSNSSESSSVTKSIPVKYSVEMTTSVNDTSVENLEFTPENYKAQKMATVYKIYNAGFKDFPINVSLFFQEQLDHDFEIKNYRVIVEPNNTQCSKMSTPKAEGCPWKENCVAIKCDTFMLKNYSNVYVSLLGDVHFRNLENYESNMPFLKKYTGVHGEVKFNSTIKVHYNGSRYVLSSQKNEKNKDYTMQQSATVTVEFKVPQHRYLIIATGVVLGFILLIILTVIMWKCGCFKRKTIEEFEEKKADFPAQTKTSSVPSHNKSEQVEEEKKPLNADKDKVKPSVNTEGDCEKVGF